MPTPCCTSRLVFDPITRLLVAQQVEQEAVLIARLDSDRLQPVQLIEIQTAGGLTLDPRTHDLILMKRAPDPNTTTAFHFVVLNYTAK